MAISLHPAVRGNVGSRSAVERGNVRAERHAHSPGGERTASTTMQPRFKRFDVRELLAQGAAVFPEIRKRVDALKPGQGIAIISPFLPSPLIEKLQSEGFTSRVEPQPDGSWVTYFSREE